jgi:cobalt transporter subunit CbtA
MFASILFRSVLAGIVVGLIVTCVHQLGTVPLILKAELFENAAEAALPAETRDHAAISALPGEEESGAAAAHRHDEEAWAPADGLERNLFTAGADILTAIGFALLLSGAYVVAGRPVTWREGLFWGCAGFLVFTVAPGLGLPPELPGMPSTALGPRQIWWVATAVLTAGGLWLLLVRREGWAAALGFALIVAPHLWGAPPPADEATNVPQSLWHSFVVAVTLTSLLMWALLGALTGFLHARRHSA